MHGSVATVSMAHTNMALIAADYDAAENSDSQQLLIALCTKIETLRIAYDRSHTCVFEQLDDEWSLHVESEGPLSVDTAQRLLLGSLHCSMLKLADAVLLSCAKIDSTVFNLYVGEDSNCASSELIAVKVARELAMIYLIVDQTYSPASCCMVLMTYPINASDM